MSPSSPSIDRASIARGLITLMIAAALAVLAAMASGAGLSDALVLVLLSVAGAGISGGLTWILIELWKGHSTARLLGLTTLAALVATAVGASLAAGVMLLSGQSLLELVVVLMAASGVGLLISTALGRRIAQGFSLVASVAGAIAADADAAAFLGAELALPLPTVELTELRRSLNQAKTELEESKAREKSLEAERRNLISWIAHDLRAPLPACEQLPKDSRTESSRISRRCPAA
jgi:signal transduction histidine kinase